MQVLKKISTIADKLILALASPDVADVPSVIVETATKTKVALTCIKQEADSIVADPSGPTKFTTITVLSDLTPFVTSAKKATDALELVCMQIAKAKRVV